ncbi:MAG: hypothetical protein RML35_12055 [Chloroherpetonaceae bacterium]|nr:hypothetical protein [Chloroherpetonaceae bacterium]
MTRHLGLNLNRMYRDVVSILREVSTVSESYRIDPEQDFVEKLRAVFPKRLERIMESIRTLRNLSIEYGYRAYYPNTLKTIYDNLVDVCEAAMIRGRV